jgi:PKD repeat protein
MRCGALVVVLATAVLGGCMFFAGTRAEINVSTTSGIVPLTIEFDGTGSTGPGGIDTYHWTFGTGEEFYGAAGTYTYRHAGTYTLTLIVRGENGKTDTQTVRIEIAPAVWVTDESLARIYKLDMDGNVVESFDAPGPRPRGITFVEIGAIGWLYVACQGGGVQRIFRLDSDSGAVDGEFVAPAQDPLYLTYGADEPKRVWHVDGLSRKIYAVNPPSVQVFDSYGSSYFHASQQVGNVPFLQMPQGLDWTESEPGSGVLWYLEGATELLYAIEIIPPFNIMSGVQLEVLGEPFAVDSSVFPVAGIDWYDEHLWVIDANHHEIVQLDPVTGLRTGEKISGFPGATASGLEIQQ